MQTECLMLCLHSKSVVNMDSRLLSLWRKEVFARSN